MCSSMNCCPRFCSSFTFADGSKFIRTSGFLQNGDLTGVIQVVLDHAVQQKVDGVRLARRLVIQAFGIERGNSPAELFMRSFQVTERDLPGSFGGIALGGPILRGRRVECFTLDEPARGVKPGGNVQDKFPDAMGAADRPVGGLLEGDIAEEILEAGTVPGFTSK